VLTEVNCWATSESPDAFGINSDGSIVVECKTSVSDFYADRRKAFRKNPDEGMGRLRYYLTVPGLLTGEQLDTVPGWGLAEVHEHCVKVVRRSTVFRHSSLAESLLLRSAWLWRKGLPKDEDVAVADTPASPERAGGGT
jgi:hypothetical protein